MVKVGFVLEDVLVFFTLKNLNLLIQLKKAELVGHAEQIIWYVHQKELTIVPMNVCLEGGVSLIKTVVIVTAKDIHTKGMDIARSVIIPPQREVLIQEIKRVREEL